MFVATLAELAAAPGPSVDTLARVLEVEADYEFVAADTTAVDGWTSIEPTGGVAGRWLLRTAAISLAPLGGGLDDWPRLIAGACACMSKVGASVRLRAGTWSAQTQQPLPNGGLVLIGGPRVEIVSTLTPDPGQPSVAPFLALAGSISSATTVAASNILGANVLAATDSVAPGAIVRIRNQLSGSGFHGNTYTVRAVSGSGPFVLELDRPVLFQFGAGDPIEQLPQIPTSIRILGNGMRITGTGTRLLEFLGARHCLVADVNFVPDAGMAIDLIASFDVFGYDNEYSHCIVDGGGIGAVGLALETQERSRITRGCVAHHCSEIGIALYDCAGCVVEDSHAWSNNHGLAVTADGNTLGCVDTVVRGGSYNGNAALGIGVHNGSTATSIDTTARFNQVNVQIGNGDSAISGAMLRGLYDRATGTAIAVINATGVVLDVVASDSAIGANFGVGTEVEIQRFVFEGATAALPNGRAILSAGNVRARGITIACSTLTNAVQMTQGAFTCTDSTVTAADGSNLFKLVAGDLTVARLVGSVGGGGTGISANDAATVRLGDAVDLSSCAIPFGGAGVFSVGTVQLDGATPVAVAQPTITAQDRVVLTMQVAGGTPGPAPLCVVTPGVGFAVSASAADTSTYAYKIV